MLANIRPRTAPHRWSRTARIAVLATTVAMGGVAIAFAATPSSAATCNGYVGLTFDDGPGGSTSSLLNVLRANNVRATMFNVGQNVQNNRSAAQAQVAAGMWVANHSWNHAHMTGMNSTQMRSDLTQTNQAIQSATGVTPRLFRPPYGETNSTLQSVASSLGMTQVLWDVDSQDWNGASVAQIVSNASRLQAGQVILMHDGIANTRTAIPQIMSNLTSRNLCPGMISPTTGRAVAPDGGNPNPTGGPTTPGGGCSVSVSRGQEWADRFNTSFSVSGTNNWVVTIRTNGGQTLQNSWNASISGTSGTLTARPNGNGNNFGITLFKNGNNTTPTATCATG